MIVARGIAHNYYADGFFGIEAHHVPETGSATEVLDEGESSLRCLARAEPAQAEVAFSSSGRDLLHHLHRFGRKQSCAIDLTLVLV